MSLGCFAQVATLATAILAGLGHFSFWWTLIPAFLAGSFQVSNGPGFDIVMTANRDGRLSVFPRLLFFNVLPWLALAGIVYWITARINSN